MRVRRVAVLGGGPGGLYAARLLKLTDPACEVTVHEQGDPDSTFGFGVGLAAGTQRKLAAADPDSLRDVLAAGRRHDMRMTGSDGSAADVVRVRNDRLIGIARTELLAILQRHAEKAGVALEFGARRSADELDADLVIAADGVSSATRENGPFGGRVTTGRGLYLWAGTEFALPDALFAPVTTEHGVLVTHAYPYSAERSTFLVETDETTWRRAGFAEIDVAPEASDEVSLRYLERAFAEQLGGRRLIGNRTRWLRFRTVTCERWSAGRTVLLGDAAHTAHYSIGSGTKLAMEDAIALVDALRTAPDRASAFAEYERVRRPAVERLQELARRSALWWESFPLRRHLPAAQLMVAYMSRAGNVPLPRFAGTSPDVVRAALRTYAGEPGPADPAAVTEWVLARQRAAFPAEPVHVDLRDPWGPDGDAVLAGVGGRAVRLTGPAERGAVLTRLDLGERLRIETGSLVEVEAPAALRDDLAAGLVSGRCDRVLLSEEEA
ncbi:2-polyprenyl-6-methoxyphenol hydroxylase [Pseudonocardia thermophila]|uniref:2-polyprenyl-6-methoxyphenol hydroxylase n=1 Tax=Pseudonocardia thermophila TaxID=1848 RepID=A0A1M6P7L9_PSETH|nr:FAD-dependent monooxygenase [Pseudonocardia thermophila]SHK03923.1 2-polyprenyl-6-methoxyphenol hydroxylase [Pseudonocardia thermophila]